MTGASEQALAAIHKTFDLAAETDDPDVLYSAAIVYTQLGQRETGMEWLKKAVAAGIPPARVRSEPVLGPLHGMKDFQDISEANNSR